MDADEKLLMQIAVIERRLATIEAVLRAVYGDDVPGCVHAPTAPSPPEPEHALTPIAIFSR